MPVKEPTIPPFSVVVHVPAPVDHAHLGLFGLCNPACLFYRNDEQSGYSCTLGRGNHSMHEHPPEHDDATGWEEPVMRPGEECPRSPHPFPPLPPGARGTDKEGQTS